jgi:hypothetical protein
VKVTREMVNKSQHLVTDYQYEGDNLGIDLYLLNQQKTLIEQTIPGIEITDYDQNFSNSKKDIKVTSTLRYEDSKIQAIISAIYSDKTTVSNLEISDNTFAEEMIQHCLIDKKGIKSLPCYESAIAHVIEQVKEEALSNEYLVKTNEMQYKLYIYSEDMEPLGVANRLLSTHNERSRIVGEYIGKNMAKFISKNLIIDLCITDDIVMRMTNVRLQSTAASAISYLSLDVSDAKIRKIDSNYNSIYLDVPKSIAFPNFNQSLSIDSYAEKLLGLNSKKELHEFIKRNKISTKPTVDINKYLIW